MVPDAVAGSDLGSNGLPKTHPQESNNYLFSIDVKHESNHPEMTANRLSDSLATHHSPVVSMMKPKSQNKKKIKVRYSALGSSLLSPII
jgi:uncharacterized protein (DUF305 family)